MRSGRDHHAGGGRYTSWSGGLLSNAFATIVSFGWGISV